MIRRCLKTVSNALFDEFDLELTYTRGFGGHCLRLGSIQKTNFSDNRLGGKCHPFSQLELMPEAHILCVSRTHEC